MTPLLAALLLTPAAPVPKPPPPNQHAYAYLGVRMSVGDDTLTIELPLEGTPAHRARLKGGDQLLQLGTLRPTAFAQISEYVLDLRPGTDIYVEVKRNGEVVKTRLVLGLRPDPPEYPNPRNVFLKRQGLPLENDDR